MTKQAVSHLPRQSHGGRRTGAGRPRTQGADEAILAATADLLRKVGLRRLTVDAVARQAGVSSASVYRRWPAKAALVAAAYRDVLGPPVPVDTGSLRGDLQEMGTEILRFFTGVHGQLLGAVLAGAEGDAELIAAVRKATAPRRAALRAVIRRAIARGEAEAGTDVELAIDLFTGPLWTRLLVTGRPINRAVVARVVDMTAAALAP